jgi:integrase/recombinase XerD
VGGEQIDVGVGVAVPFSHQWLRNSLIMRGYAPNTVTEYFYAIVRADTWMSQRHERLDTCSAQAVRRYVEEDVPNTWSSRKLVRSALMAYWELVERDDAPIDAIRIPPKPRFACRALEPHDAQRLAQVACEWASGGEGLAVMFGLYAALRRFEIAKLQWGDINGTQLHVMGKGDVSASIPLHPKIRQKLEWWQGFAVADPTDCRTRPGASCIFQGRYADRPVTPTTVWTWVRKVAREADLPDLTPHQLRHTALATANDTTHDLRATQAFARHADPMTTVLYTRVDRDRLNGVVMSLGY